MPQECAGAISDVIGTRHGKPGDFSVVCEHAHGKGIGDADDMLHTCDIDEGVIRAKPIEDY